LLLLFELQPRRRVLAPDGRRPLLEHAFLVHEVVYGDQTTVVRESEALALVRAVDGADGQDAGEAGALGLKRGLDGFGTHLVIGVGAGVGVIAG